MMFDSSSTRRAGSFSRVDARLVEPMLNAEFPNLSISILFARSQS